MLFSFIELFTFRRPRRLFFVRIHHLLSFESIRHDSLISGFFFFFFEVMFIFPTRKFTEVDLLYLIVLFAFIRKFHNNHYKDFFEEGYNSGKVLFRKILKFYFVVSKSHDYSEKVYLKSCCSEKFYSEKFYSEGLLF